MVMQNNTVHGKHAVVDKQLVDLKYKRLPQNLNNSSKLGLRSSKYILFEILFSFKKKNTSEKYINVNKSPNINQNHLCASCSFFIS